MRLDPWLLVDLRTFAQNFVGLFMHLDKIHVSDTKMLVVSVAIVGIRPSKLSVARHVCEHSSSTSGELVNDEKSLDHVYSEAPES